MGGATAAANAGHLTGFGSKGYRSYVLLTLTLTYTLNFIDRILITLFCNLGQCPDSSTPHIEIRMLQKVAHCIDRILVTIFMLF